MKKQFQFKFTLIIAFIIDVTFSVKIAYTDHAGVANGDAAPDFSLPDTNNRIITLSDHEGSENVVLVFYRGQW